MNPPLEPAIRPDEGSFRDPSGRVVEVGDQIYRVVDDAMLGMVRELQSSGLLQRLADEGMMVRTRILESGDPVHARLLADFPDARGVLHHERIPFVSYPHEWSPAMIASAALLTLTLQDRLLQQGFSLKDASAYNVQFKHATPMLIDITSIEKPRRLDLWIAYGQFCSMFLFPILLHRFRQVDTRGLYLTSMEGVSVEAASRMLGWQQYLRPSLFLDVGVQSLFQKQEGRSRLVDPSGLKTGPVGNPAVQQVNLQRLSGIIRRASRPRRQKSSWNNYTSTCNYDAVATGKKTEFIRRVLRVYQPGMVLDLGCNTGVYSMMAADAGAQVVAVDADRPCVDSLFEQASRQGKSVLPLWMGVDNPSPAIGFQNRERKGFLQRIRPDGVFALALIHHLLVASRIPLEKIAGMLHGLTNDWCVVEYVSHADPMFQSLLVWRDDLYETYTELEFEAVFGRYFKCVEKMTVIAGRRILYLFRKHACSCETP